MRIISGTLKGRTIPFNSRRFGNARVTSGRVKEAVFSILGTDLSGKRFLDLFAGSGQIGLEAYSRGAYVVMNEFDRRRHGLIEDLVAQWGLSDQLALHCRRAEELVPSLVTVDERFDVAYLDPPYGARTGDQPLAVRAAELLSEARLMDPRGHIVIQHDLRTSLPEAVGEFALNKRRDYGDTSLSILQGEPHAGHGEC